MKNKKKLIICIIAGIIGVAVITTIIYTRYRSRHTISISQLIPSLVVMQDPDDDTWENPVFMWGVGSEVRYMPTKSKYYVSITIRPNSVKYENWEGETEYMLSQPGDDGLWNWGLFSLPGDNKLVPGEHYQAFITVENKSRTRRKHSWFGYFEYVPKNLQE